MKSTLRNSNLVCFIKHHSSSFEMKWNRNKFYYEGWHYVEHIFSYVVKSCIIVEEIFESQCYHSTGKPESPEIFNIFSLTNVLVKLKCQ